MNYCPFLLFKNAAIPFATLHLTYFNCIQCELKLNFNTKIMSFTQPNGWQNGLFSRNFILFIIITG